MFDPMNDEFSVSIPYAILHNRALGTLTFSMSR